MNQQPTIIMEGNFNEYNLLELLEVTSLCRQLIQVTLIKSSNPQGLILMKAGQVLDAKVGSGQTGLFAFSTLLEHTFEAFKVLKFKSSGLKLPEPIGSLADLLLPSDSDTIRFNLPKEGFTEQQANDESLDDLALVGQMVSQPKSDSSPTPASSLPQVVSVDQAPLSESPIVSGETKKIDPREVKIEAREQNNVVPARAENTLIEAVSENKATFSQNPFLKPPSLSGSGLGSKITSNKKVTASSKPSPFTTPKKASTPNLQTSPLVGGHQALITSEDRGSQEQDTNILQVEENSNAEVLQLVKSSQQQLNMLGEQFTKLQAQFDTVQHALQAVQNQQPLLHQVNQQQSLQQQVLQMLPQQLGKTHSQQEIHGQSLNQILEQANQMKQGMIELHQDLQQVQFSLSRISPAGDSSSGALDQQVMMELIKGRDQKRFGHLTPMLIVSLFIQIISLVAMVFVVVKLLS